MGRKVPAALESLPLRYTPLASFDEARRRVQSPGVRTMPPAAGRKSRVTALVGA